MASTNNHQSLHSSSAQKLQEYVAVVIRGRWIVMASFLVVFGLAILYVLLAPRVYQATAGVRIDTKQLQSSLFRDDIMSMSAAMNMMQNEIEILKSNALAKTVAKILTETRYLDSAKTKMISLVIPSPDDPDRRPIASEEQIMMRVKPQVEFEPVRESDVIKITARSKDPHEAALIANTYARAYFERNVYASRNKSRSFREFLENQVREKQSALAHAEDSLRHYMERSGVVSLDEESQKMVNQVSQLEAQRDAVTISIQSLEKTISSYREQVSQQEENVAKVMGEANDPYIRLLQDQLAQLEVQRDVTVAQNPTYVGKEIYNARLNEIDGQIQALKVKLKKRTDEFLINLLPGGPSSGEQRDPAGYLKQVKQKMLESHIELQSMIAREKALSSAIADYNRQFERMPKRNMEFARLQRDKMSLEKLYLLIEEKYNEANITEQGELGYIDIFDPALIPIAPSSPKVILSLGLGLIAGFGLGFVIVFGKEYLRERIRTPEDLKKHGYLPLTTVLAMTSGQKKAGKNDGESKPGVAQLIMVTNPLSPIAESYRHLRTTLHLSQKDSQESLTILVTSADPGEGKTTTVANLAVAFARSGKRVLLVDADLRKPAVHAAFTLRIKPGMSEILAKQIPLDQAIQRTNVQNLHVITSGLIPSNPAEVLGSDTTKALLRDLKSRYDVILFDSAPLLAVTDASILATEVDRVVLVVASGSTGIETLDRAKDMLEGVGAQISGVVLNNFDARQAYGLFFSHSGYGYYGYGDKGPKGRDIDLGGDKLKAREV